MRNSLFCRLPCPPLAKRGSLTHSQALALSKRARDVTAPPVALNRCALRLAGHQSPRQFFVRDGTMTQHRFLLEVGAHARPYNRCSIGICYEGGLDEHGKPCDTRTPEQTERIGDVLKRLHKLFPKAKIVGHRDLPGTTPKECPCLDAHALFGWIENCD